MRVLVTGAGGSLGHNVVIAALRRDLEVRALVRDRARARLEPDVDVREGDARDGAAVRRALEGCDALFHLANVNLTEDWVRTTGALLTAALDACRATGARLVFPANVWVYGPGAPGRRVDEGQPLTPTSQKGCARAVKEARIRAAGVRSVVLRLPEFYGPHVQTLTGPPLQQISQRRAGFWFGPTDVDVEFVYMPDAAEALLTVGLAEGVDGEVFHLPGERAITPRKFFALACALAGGGSLRAVPSWAVRAASLVSPAARSFADIMHLWTAPVLLDGAKLARRFPTLRATPYADGLAHTLAWLRAHPDARMYY